MKELDCDGDVLAGKRYPFTVVAEYGLAARDSAMIVRAVQGMEGSVVIGNECKEANARSIMEILTLEMFCGRTGFLRFDKTQSAAPLKVLYRSIKIREFDDE